LSFKIGPMSSGSMICLQSARYGSSAGKLSKVMAGEFSSGLASQGRIGREL